jgi:subtilisin family serine protease
MQRTFRFFMLAAAAAALAACGGGDPDAASQGRESPSAKRAPTVDARLQRLALPAGAVTSAVDPRLARAKGPVRVWVSLDDASVASFKAAQLEAQGSDMQARSIGSTSLVRAPDAAEVALKRSVSSHREIVRGKQDSLMGQLRGMGATELARVQLAHNAVAVTVDAGSLASIARLPGVAKVRPVINYTMDLSETVPYVGGAAVQASGRTGAGVKVAVLDSGIDYTHRNLGGAGTAKAYAAAYGTSPSDAKNTTRDGLFPTAKVVAGHDFVGEDWPNTAEAPDNDPIDFEGHGTHVADIIAGRSRDGTHKGMAPGALLYAVKVCSAVATSCSGVALIQAMDFALDPNGDGDISDAVDVINMSLGSNYGQEQDDLTVASSNAVKLGVVVVTSAGNGGNLPYIAGSPSTGVGVISVAQTQVPSAVSIPLAINSPASIAGVYANTETLSFAPVGAGVSGDVVFYGDGCPGSPVVNNPAGKIALIDRGACAVSLKVDSAAKAGATGVLIGLVAPGDPISFSYGGGDTFVPSLVIQQVASNAIKAQLSAGNAVNVSISPASAIALVGSMAGSSSRGPAYSTQHIKPEIGAPGASVSAEVGTGTGETAFGGTSGAAPMVSGAAALLVEAFPKRSPSRIKAMLMNSAETAIYTSPAVVPGELAPITRIGAGELRVNRAIALDSIAWNQKTMSAALSFGAHEVSKKTALEQTLRIDNMSDVEKVYTVTPSFRYASDRASGAVAVTTRQSVRVSPHSFQEIDVKLVIDPTKLPAWALNGGSQGGNGAALNGPEYDGYVTLTSGAEKLSVPWHVLPRKAAENAASLLEKNGTYSVQFNNKGADVGEFDLFSLLGTSSRIPGSDLPKPGDNAAVIDIRAFGARFLPAAEFGDDYLEFAISTQGRRAHPNYPAQFEVYLDVDLDGVDDFVVFNAELGGFGATGQNVVNVVDLATGAGGAFFYSDADLNSGSIIMTVPMAVMGLASGTTVGVSVYVADNYFTGNYTDAIEGKRFTPGQERYTAAGVPFDVTPAKGRSTAPLQVTAVPYAKSTEGGVLVMHRRNAGAEADVVRIR